MNVNNNFEMTWRKIAYLAAVDFGLMWLMWAIAAWYKTEKLNEFFGAGTIGILALIAYEQFSKGHPRAKIQTLAIILWSIRLTTYVFSRILELGHDVRYGDITNQPLMFLLLWNNQGFWILATALPSLIAIVKQEQPPLKWKDWLGWALFAVGFVIECVADYQKSHFRHIDPSNWDKFITSGLWSVSRHPNYFGEILLWTGLCLTASSTFSGWEYAAFLNPIYVVLQIVYLTGVVPLEEFASKKWGDLPEYQAYTERTAVLVPYVW